jgi:hypothetical protein
MDSETLIARLSSDLRPVRRIIPSWLGLSLWLLCAFVAAGLVAWVHGMNQPLHEAMDNWQERANIVFSVLTALAAAYAAFELARPDASRHWLWLPIPPAIAWFAGLGIGCIAELLPGGAETLHGEESAVCLGIIVAVGVPLTLAHMLMMRHAALTRPVEVSALAGLAAAAFSSAVLSLLHGVEASGLLLLWHGTSVLLVAWMGKRFGAQSFALVGLHAALPVDREATRL